MILIMGQGRCGSSLVMQALYAAGADCWCDESWPAFEPADIAGHDVDDIRTNDAAKIVDPLLTMGHDGIAQLIVPGDNVVWLTRHPLQQALSQLQMVEIATSTRNVVERTDVRRVRRDLAKREKQTLQCISQHASSLTKIHFEELIGGLAAWIPLIQCWPALGPAIVRRIVVQRAEIPQQMRVEQHLLAHESHYKQRMYGLADKQSV